MPAAIGMMNVDVRKRMMRSTSRANFSLSAHEPTLLFIHGARAIRIRRFVLPALLTLAILLIRGAPSLGHVSGPLNSGYSLELPRWYVAFSPFSRLLDALSLLSNPQSIAVFVSFAIVLVGWAAARPGRNSSLVKQIGFAFATAVLAIGITEAAVVFLPRPMAKLVVNDRDIVRIDFHSHTRASHDVRESFTAERNREWHRSGGFDVAYISDHVKFDGAVAARQNNPRLAGGGTSLLMGVEGRYHKIISTIMLGLTERDTALLNHRGNLLPGATSSGVAPVTIIALPNRNLDSITVESLDSIPRFVAIEIVDAAPRGLGQFDRDEMKVREIASRLHLVLVAASNNHGFGRTVAAWNLMSVPGWQAMSPDSLGTIIENALRERNQSAVSVIARARPRLHGAAVAGTLPALLYHLVGSLSNNERIAWLLWLWVPFLILSASAKNSLRRRRVRKKS